MLGSQTRQLRGTVAAASPKIERLVLVLSNRLRWNWGKHTLELSAGDAVHWNDAPHSEVFLIPEGEAVELLHAAFVERIDG